MQEPTDDGNAATQDTPSKPAPPEPKGVTDFETEVVNDVGNADSIVATVSPESEDDCPRSTSVSENVPKENREEAAECKSDGGRDLIGEENPAFGLSLAESEPVEDGVGRGCSPVEVEAIETKDDDAVGDGSVRTAHGGETPSEEPGTRGNPTQDLDAVVGKEPPNFSSAMVGDSIV